MSFDEEHDELNEELKSKSQLKREMHAIQKIGEELVNLGSAALAKIPLDEELSKAIILARDINKKKEGYRRQLQFIGKLLRSRDLDPINDALNKLKNHHQLANVRFHKLEILRDKLLSEGDSAIQATLEEHPGLERQKLRQFLRQAKKEQEQGKPPTAARELFKYLRSELDKE
ncbi:ribosome-associated protein [Paraneptunicella aestuarii]|uniref:ribosome biogenesis factor YjgA n=1 Tax=Paraneptunicella aestuarii TaxID=2831148 RepID=UPI001E51DB4F|nr:ribosome biogenesis factor YjgA [Paraneptunicella aestuarii]UAA39112.1 ribosome-associated protein [Paraneptunicella aestuarii]